MTSEVFFLSCFLKSFVVNSLNMCSEFIRTPPGHGLSFVEVSQSLIESLFVAGLCGFSTSYEIRSHLGQFMHF
jgi:hypothetical protein